MLVCVGAAGRSMTVQIAVRLSDSWVDPRRGVSELGSPSVTSPPKSIEPGDRPCGRSGWWVSDPYASRCGRGRSGRGLPCSPRLVAARDVRAGAKVGGWWPAPQRRPRLVSDSRPPVEVHWRFTVRAPWGRVNGQRSAGPPSTCPLAATSRHPVRVPMPGLRKCRAAFHGLGCMSRPVASRYFQHAPTTRPGTGWCGSTPPA